METQSLILIFGGILVFIVFREVLNWYWKINYRVKLLERIDNNLQYIARLLKTQAPANVDKLIDKTFEEDTENKGSN